MEEIILETKELCKQYHKQTVLKNINMRIPKGCVYGLLGANGAGKSTLMKILCGMTRADAGEVFFDGKIWSRKCIERIGALIELPPVYENLSAVDNLKVRTWTLGISDARILEVLDIVDLKNTGKKQVGKFSMGMKQRLGIAVALLNDPDFLILDEPANGLDPFGIRQLREMLVSFAESGMTVLVSSHILGEIQQTADYIGILACGDCGRTTKGTYLEILEFTHFVDFFSFNRLEENHKEKVLVKKVTVVVALDLGTGNTKNPEL